MTRMQPLHFDTKGIEMRELESYCEGFCDWAKKVNWYLGDAVIAAKQKSPENWSQAFPVEFSVGQLERCEAVSRAYKPDERNQLATWSVHRTHTNRPDRVARVQASVDAGRTSDEERAAAQEERANGTQKSWLLAFDMHYFAHRHYYSGAGVETAMQVSQWVERTVERLKLKGATDVVCAFEGRGSSRKQIVENAGWEEKYKDRPPRPEDLNHQLQLVRTILEGMGFLCVSVDGWEADDVLASYAAQFPGKTTIITSDKDLRQCLSDNCNILLDVEWHEDETSGEAMPEYKWLSAKLHTETTGIRPDQWCDYQMIMGDNCDNIKGVAGIGEKGAKDLVQQFGSVEEAIAAAKAEDESIRPKKREALIEFEPKLAVTRQLVTLRTDLPLPGATRV